MLHNTVISLGPVVDERKKLFAFYINFFTYLFLSLYLQNCELLIFLYVELA